MPEFAAEDFVNLSNCGIRVRLMVWGVVGRAFSGVRTPCRADIDNR